MFRIDLTAMPHWADAFQGLGTAAGVIVSLLGFLFVTRQMRYTRQAIIMQTQAQIYNMGLEAYRVLIEHPDLGRYFNDGEPAPGAGPERHKAFAAFELFCDYFEYIIIEQQDVSADVRASWMRYMEKLFQRSPAIREYVESRRDQYTPAFLDVFDKATRTVR